MPTAHFTFTLEDHRTPDSFVRAVGRNQVNITPDGSQKPLGTTRAKDPTPLSNLTTWSYSDILQGTATLKPVGATYDVFNQTTSNSFVDILDTAQNNSGHTLGPDALLSPQQQAIGPYDVILRAKLNGTAPDSQNMTAVVAGATNAPGQTTFSAPPPKGDYRKMAELRNIWGNKAATSDQLTQVTFQSVAPSNPNKKYTVRKETVALWQIVDSIFVKHKYQIKQTSGGFNNRAITGGSGLSMHAFGCAIDVNAPTNPYQATLKTDMPQAMIAEIEALRSNQGSIRAIRWGGRYTGNKDAMHFEVMLTPQELLSGIKRY